MDVSDSSSDEEIAVKCAMNLELTSTSPGPCPLLDGSLDINICNASGSERLFENQNPLYFELS